jgi:hypothetical protein
MAMGLIRPPTQISSSYNSWGRKGGRYIELTALPISSADYLAIWEPQAPETLKNFSRFVKRLFCFKRKISDRKEKNFRARVRTFSSTLTRTISIGVSCMIRITTYMRLTVQISSDVNGGNVELTL